MKLGTNLEKHWINTGEVLELLPGPVLYYTKNSNFSQKMLEGQCSKENLICAPFCATLKPPSAPARARKNSLSTSHTGEECGGVSRATSPKPFHTTEHRSVWLETLHYAELQLLMHPSSSSTCKGLPNSSLIICVTTATLWSCWSLKLYSFVLQGWVPTLFASLPTLRSLAYDSF